MANARFARRFVRVVKEPLCPIAEEALAEEIASTPSINCLTRDRSDVHPTRWWISV